MKPKNPVLSRAIRRITKEWGLSQTELIEILQISEDQLAHNMDPENKGSRAGVLLLSAFKSLNTVVGGKQEKAILWLRTHNNHLAGIPIQIMKSDRGLVRVSRYLDALGV